MKAAAPPNGAQGLAHGPFIRDAHQHLSKRQRNITSLKTRFSQQNSTNGPFSLTSLCLWDEHTVSRAQQSRGGWWLQLIKPIPVPQFPAGSQQSPRLFSTGRALKMEYELWKHHLPHARNAGPGAQCPQLQSPAFWIYEQGKSRSQNIKSTKK